MQYLKKIHIILIDNGQNQEYEKTVFTFNTFCTHCMCR
jgi:hypothetical protein